MIRSEWSMTKRPWMIAVALVFTSHLALAGQKPMTNSESWSGIIINSGCSSEEAFAEAPKCTEKIQGAKLAFYDDTTRKIYDVEPQARAAGHLGDSVTLRGVLEENTIRVASLKLLTSFGLPVGRKAPAFAARDQFGREQTLESLKGPHGTILLLFRSADW